MGVRSQRCGCTLFFDGIASTRTLQNVRKCEITLICRYIERFSQELLHISKDCIIFVMRIVVGVTFPKIVGIVTLLLFITLCLFFLPVSEPYRTFNPHFLVVVRVQARKRLKTLVLSIYPVVAEGFRQISPYIENAFKGWGYMKVVSFCLFGFISFYIYSLSLHQKSKS